MLLLYVLDVYNVKKYFIEYPKNHMYICFDGVDGFVNLRFKHNDNEYLFVEFVPKNCRLISAFKRVLKLNDRSSALKSVLCMIIDKFNSESKKDEQGEFKYTILHEKDKDLKFEKEKYPSIHIFTDDKYHDNTYPGKMIYNRLKKKLPLVYFSFEDYEYILFKILFRTSLSSFILSYLLSFMVAMCFLLAKNLIISLI